ncbi:ankyrin repeat-containing domain protein [Parachaetomium inaequale]|uniref:Ankyrin repeat-containing domain protein n=1 Tax=Parachaetomium inaequale TaxID=2588326 RepID=A0AAN6PM61_9PEZI|nr:ankyrin repeat-containing domain protein [Parachaetomium inaequale]
MATGIMWLVYATRPLTSTELGAAMICEVAGDGASIIDPDMATNSFLDMLCGLAWLREGRVCITHPALSSTIVAKQQDSTDATWYHIPNGPQRIADVCMNLITAFDGSCSPALSCPSTSPAPKPAAHVLLSYAIENWYTHAIKTNHTSLDHSFIVSLLVSKLSKPKFDLWFTALLRQAVDADGRSAIYHATGYGYLDIVNELLRHEAQVYASDDGGRPLDIACERGHVQVLKTVLEMAPPAKYKGSQEHVSSALEKACSWGQTNALRALLPYYDRRRYEGSADGPLDFLLCVTSRHGRIDTVLFLLDQRASQRAHDWDYGGRTPLHHAASYNSPKLAQLLILRGAPLDVGDDETKTPLIIVSSANAFHVAEILVKAGADLSVEDSDGTSALYAATLRGHTRLVRFLLDAGGANLTPPRDYAQSCQTILDFALLYGTRDDFEAVSTYFTETASEGTAAPMAASPNAVHAFLRDEGSDSQRIEVLLSRHGLDINMGFGDDHGTILHLAASLGRLDVAELLLSPQHGCEPANCNILREGLGTPLQVAAGGSTEAHVEIDKEANNLVAGHFGSVLQSAVASGYVRMVKLIVKFGVREATTPSGVHGTPLHAAVDAGDAGIVGYLIDARGVLGMTADTRDQEGRLPHHIAALRDNTVMFRKFVAHVSDSPPLRTRDYQGRNALHLALGQGSVEVIDRILKRDPEMVHEKDDDGWTALHWACRGQENAALVRRLLEMGADKKELTQRGWLPRDVAAFHRCDFLADVEVANDPAPLPRGMGMHGEIEGRRRVTSAADLVVGTTCDSCYCRLYGLRYRCRTCWKTDICFKCFRHVKKCHYKGHTFSKTDAFGLELEILDPWV